jgi:hypothetical protein
VVVGSASAGLVSYRDEVLADAPAGYWRVGESSGTVADDEVGDNNGRYKNGVVLGRPSALATDMNTAVGFDGGNDEVEILDPADGSLDVGTGDFTLEAWVRTDAVGDTERGLMSKRDPTAFWLVSVTDDSGHFGQLRIQASDGTVSRTAYTLHRVDDTSWHHIVIAFDRDVGITSYVDGNYSGLTVGALPGDMSNTGLMTFGKGSGIGALFKGDVDEVALYRSLLSPERVQAHYYAALADSSPPAVTLLGPPTRRRSTTATPAPRSATRRP